MWAGLLATRPAMAQEEGVHLPMVRGQRRRICTNVVPDRTQHCLKALHLPSLAGGSRGDPRQGAAVSRRPCPQWIKNHQKQKEMGKSAFKIFHESGSRGEGRSQEEEGEGTVTGLFFGGWTCWYMPPQPAEKAQMGQGL